MTKLIILAGDQNVGKTTTLRNFAEKLLLVGNNSPSYAANVKSFFLSQVRNGKFLDLWIVIPTPQGYIYIATKGDNKVATTANIKFFSQDYPVFKSLRPRAKVYTFDTNGKAEKIKDLSEYRPTICFSGSRMTNSVLSPLLNYAETKSHIGAGIIINMHDNIQTPQRYAHFEQVLTKLL